MEGKRMAWSGPWGCVTETLKAQVGLNLIWWTQEMPCGEPCLGLSLEWLQSGGSQTQGREGQTVRWGLSGGARALEGRGREQSRGPGWKNQHDVEGTGVPIGDLFSQRQFLLLSLQPQPDLLSLPQLMTSFSASFVPQSVSYVHSFLFPCLFPLLHRGPALPLVLWSLGFLSPSEIPRQHLLFSHLQVWS